MEKNTGINEFLIYLTSLEIPDFLKPNVDKNGHTIGYEIQYRPCGFRESSENGIVYCLAAETLGFVGTGIVEEKCEFFRPFDELEAECNQPKKKSL